MDPNHPKFRKPGIQLQILRPKEWHFARQLKFKQRKQLYWREKIVMPKKLAIVIGFITAPSRYLPPAIDCGNMAVGQGEG